MRRSGTIGFALLLILSCTVVQPAPCLSWEELLAEESISNIAIGGPNISVGILVSFIYLNPPDLGECVLGEEAYNTLTEKTLADRSEVHGFWVGASGPYASVFKAKNYYLVQADRRLDLVTEPMPAPAAGVRLAPSTPVQHLLFFKGKLDISDPITIFFERGDATYSTEYWVDEKYERGLRPAAEAHE